MTSAVVLSLDGQAIDQLLHSDEGDIGVWLTRTGQHVVDLARTRIRPSRVTTRTGLGLRDSIVKRMGRDSDGLVMTVLAATDYSLFVHEGTAPHIIAPRRRNSLYFYSVKAGRFIIVTKNTGGPRSAYLDAQGRLVTNKGYVNHPGTRPNRFLVEPLVQVLSR